MKKAWQDLQIGSWRQLKTCQRGLLTGKILPIFENYFFHANRHPDWHIFGCQKAKAYNLILQNLIEKYFKILLRGSKVYLWYKFAFLLQNILQLILQIKQSLFNSRLDSNFLDQGCRVASWTPKFHFPKIRLSCRMPQQFFLPYRASNPVGRNPYNNS